MERGLAEQVRAGGIIKSVFSTAPEELVKVHAAASLAEKRLWQKCDGVTGLMGNHFGHILDQHGGIRGCEQSHQGSFDFTLTRSADFMVVIFYRNANILQHLHHIRA